MKMKTMNEKNVLRDAFKKNSIWRDIVPTSYYPLPPSKVGKFVKLLYLPRNDIQKNFSQSFTLFFVKICKNGLQVAENVKIGES